MRRAADEELARTRSELESLQAAAPGAGSWGAQGHLLGGHGGPPAMAAPGFKWVLVSEAEEAAAAAGGAAAAAGLSRRLSSMSGAQQLSGMLDEDLAAAAAAGQLGGSQSHQGSEAAGLFDPGELFGTPAAGVVTPSYTPRASAAGAGAALDAAASASVASQGYAGGVVSSPTASVTSSRAAGARAVAARLGGGSSTVAEAAVQRLRAALRQKAGECASMEGRLRELEATRDQLASELVKATRSAEQVGLLWGVQVACLLVDMWRCGWGGGSVHVGLLACLPAVFPELTCVGCKGCQCVIELTQPLFVVVCPCCPCSLQASDAVLRLPQLQAEYAALEVRYAAAVELLGERDEALEEMAADLADVKQLYKQQIEALVAQLAAAGDAGGGSAAG